MRRALWFVSVVTTLGIVGLGPRAMTSVSAQQGQTLGGGASSPEELAQRLLDALEREDLDALRRLRVTESEYKDIILAGTAAGQPARTLRPDVADYAWKSSTPELSPSATSCTSSGQHYEVKHLSLKGTADYASTAHTDSFARAPAGWIKAGGHRPSPSGRRCSSRSSG
jgi:hypothetical protein